MQRHIINRKRFVRYKEGAEMYSMCQSKFEKWQRKQMLSISWINWYW